MKMVFILIIILTIFFFPKENYSWGSATGLVLDCSCLGIKGPEDGWIGGAYRSCYGVPIACKTFKLHPILFLNNFGLFAVLLAEIIIFVGIEFSKPAKKL